MRLLHRADKRHRRQFVAGAGASMAAAALASRATAQTKPYRIDVHHHVSPPTWNAALRRENAGQPPTYNWSAQKSLDDMDKSGVATSVASITTPGISFLGKDEAIRISRDSNEYMAKLMADHPGRFGLFATLPLPNIDETLKEIAYAFDTLKADGVCMMTSYDNKWLGHAHYAPVMEELNRRKAVVYTHPTSAACCTNLLPEFREPVVEYGTDTTRTIGSLVFSGASQIVYGTDFPFRTNEDHVRGLSAFFNLMDMKAIDRDNALRFIPRLKAA
jgi:predicted TIM-barrel fold metal-dependent hydrolase